MLHLLYTRYYRRFYDAQFGPDAVRRDRLAQTALPRLWIPKCENLYKVDALPALGSGKLDLRALKIRAGQLAAAAVPRRA